MSKELENLRKKIDKIDFEFLKKFVISEKMQRIELKNKIPKVFDLKLIGSRIILRPLKFSDIPNIYSNIQGLKIAEHKLWVSYPFKPKDAREYIKKARKSLRARKSFVFGIELKSKKEIIGCFSLYDADLKLEHEIGYWLGEKYHGQGLMSEAAMMVLDFAFKKLKFHRVWADVFSDNIASQKLLKKLGFKKEGYHRKSFWHWGRWRDSVHFGLLAEEFLNKSK